MSSPEMTVDRLKVLAVGHLHDPTESAKTSLYHKLVQVSTSTVLNEDRTLTQECVRENGKNHPRRYSVDGAHTADDNTIKQPLLF